jgi:hypothetical protein
LEAWRPLGRLIDETPSQIGLNWRSSDLNQNVLHLKFGMYKIIKLRVASIMFRPLMPRQTSHVRIETVWHETST